MRCERRHRPDCGHFHGTHPEIMIQIAAVGIIAAILLPGWLAEFHKGKACVDLLARGGAGACPLTGTAYAPGDVAVCAGDHLPSSPRFPRQGGPPEQTLPPASGSSDPVQVRPSFLWRWVAAPLLMTVCLVLMGGCAVFAMAGWRTALIPLLAVLAAGLALWVCARSAWTSQTIEASKGRVVHRRWILGVERAPLVYEGATSVVPVRTRPSEIQAVLVHGRQASPLAFMKMEDVARLDALLR